MNQVNVFRLLQSHGFEDKAAREMIDALQENQDLTTKQDLFSVKQTLKEDILAIKSEIRSDIKDLEIRMLNAIQSQTNRYIAALAVLGVIFKLAEMYIK